MSNTRKTILVVEDERPLLEVVQIKLEGGGFDVVTARSVGQNRMACTLFPRLRKTVKLRIFLFLLSPIPLAKIPNKPTLKWV